MKNSLIAVFVFLSIAGLTACSSGGGASTAEVVKEEPVVMTSAATAAANSQAFVITVDTELSVTLDGGRGSSYRFSVTEQPSNGALIGQLSGINPTMVYTPKAGFIGDDSFQFSVIDDEGNADNGLISIQIVAATPVNPDNAGDDPINDQEEPVATVPTATTTATASSQTFAIAVDTELSVKLGGKSAASYRFAITGQPANGTLVGLISGINPTVVYTPNAGFIGDDSFQFSVTDNEGNTSSGVISIQVVATSQANLDTDGDGLTDLDELKKYGTSPILADTDADGFSDFKEVITFGFDASVNNLRFNPLIADIPQIDVQLTSAPDIFLNYTTTSGTSSSISTNRSQSSSQSVSFSETLGQSTSFEKSYTEGTEISAETETTVSLSPEVSAKVGVNLSYSETSTFGRESSQSWTEEQSRENSSAVDQGKAFEESNSIATSGGGLAVTVQISNGGNISYRLTNLFLSATYIDLSRPDPIVPVGNLSFENSSGFQAFTLAPDEFSGQLNFSTAELTIDTTKNLLSNSQGLIITPAVFDMLDENGVSYTFNNTAMRAQDAMVIVDFAGLNAQETLRLNVATNANPEQAGITIADVLQNVLKLNIGTDATDGFLTEVAGVSNNEPIGRWVILHGAQQGNNNIVTTIYSTPSDKNRVQSLNANISNIVSSYDLTQVLVRGGDILHLVYLLDDDQDGISNRSEQVYGTRIDNADTDGDQLSDSAEVNGWEITYLEKSGAMVRQTVTSNPLLTDTDGDGISDFTEANTLVSDSSLKRNPQSKDTDGDGLADNIDDLDTAGDFAASVFDPLDIDAMAATVTTQAVSGTPGTVDVSYNVFDVTEAGAGNPGNAINSYEVHVYRHASSVGVHPEPVSPPIDYATAVPGQTLTCGSGCSWELVDISPSIPGAATINFTDPIDQGDDNKYIAYIRINGLYRRSVQAAFASAAVETVTIHVLPGGVVLPGGGYSNTALTNVRTVTDFRTLISDPGTTIMYSPQYDEMFVSQGIYIPTTGLYGVVYDPVTLAQKSMQGAGDLFGNNSDRFFYGYCPGYETISTEGTCWVSYEWRVAGYVTDAVSANDVGNALSHPLGTGDGGFTLDWLIKFDDSVITPRPGLASDELRYICGTYNDRISSSADFSDDQSFSASSPATTSYVRRPNAIDTSCDSIDVFADTYYDIDPNTGGSVFSRTLPAQAACYRIRFLAYEYNENTALNGGYYNKVAYPFSGEADFANVDEAELCRDEAGIWTLTGKQLRPEHELSTRAVPATTAGNPNFINYTTRPLLWDDNVARTTEEGRLRVNYLIQVTAP